MHVPIGTDILSLIRVEVIMNVNSSVCIFIFF